ncbi:TPA: hypothetical protein RG395_002088 [Legionella pneumophila]|nr:hypothetical protein [Legionella pneumophila]HAT1846842.1 hypothetical protein [Legionella pneumophila]HAT1862012.1 hypothetical protein [Legionella pneumophila]HAT8356706.1 hypothetical protein [Legionella pneumophila]HAU1206412.1 hypothetical protein [Legionella pneumophila]HAU1283732.1 hypothetical protein [Legionella pneumophila]
MWNCDLSTEWINNTLDQLAKDPQLFYSHDISLFDSWVIFVQSMIVKKEEFKASEFLLACIGYFVFYDLNDQKICLPADLTQRQPNIRFRRPLNALDVLEIKKRFNSILIELTQKLSKHCDLQEQKTAFSWFEFLDGLQRQAKFDRYIRRYRMIQVESTGEKPRVRPGQQEAIGSIALIPREFIQYIFYDHYGIEPQIIKDDLIMVNRCTADEAVQKLGIEKHNLIKKCLDDGIGVYVNSRQYQLHRMSGSIQKEIIDARVDYTYLYPYRGLVRLRRSEVESLHDASITVNGKQYCHVWLQHALAELIQGYAWCIELRGTQQITIDDLWFIDDEISVCLRKSVPVPTEILGVQTTTSINTIPLADDRTGSLKTDPQLVFSKKGDLYEITYQNKTIQLSCSLGLDRLAYLIQNPHKKISALELTQKFNKSNCDSQIEQSNECVEHLAQQGISSDPFYSDDPIHDKTAEIEYKNKEIQLTNEIKKLKREEIEARERGDVEQAEKLKDLQLEKAKELDEFLNFIKKDKKTRGKSRRHQTGLDKARSSVQQTIKNAIKKITIKYPELGAYLSDTIETGSQCRYSPK